MPVPSWLIWFLFGVAFYVLELAFPGLIIFFFGIGAWCTAFALFFLDISLSVQLGIFIITSLLSMFALRSVLKKIFLGDRKTEGEVLPMFAPASGVVVEAIVPPAEGKVKYSGSYWQACADEPVEEGTVVEIVEQKDLLVKVRPAQ